MDGPNVNVKLLQVIQDYRKDKGSPHLLDIETYGLHVMNHLKRALKKVNGK